MPTELIEAIEEVFTEPVTISKKYRRRKTAESGQFTKARSQLQDAVIKILAEIFAEPENNRHTKDWIFRESGIFFNAIINRYRVECADAAFDFLQNSVVISRINAVRISFLKWQKQQKKALSDPTDPIKKPAADLPEQQAANRSNEEVLILENLLAFGESGIKAHFEIQNGIARQRFFKYLLPDPKKLTQFESTTAMLDFLIKLGAVQAESRETIATNGKHLKLCLVFINLERIRELLAEKQSELNEK